MCYSMPLRAMGLSVCILQVTHCCQTWDLVAGVATILRTEHRQIRDWVPRTVVKVDDGWVPGDTGVKVGHEGGDVLCGCQHAMSDLPREDEPFERSKVQTSEELGESLNFLHCYVWHPNNMINKTGKQDPKVQTSRDWKKHTCTKVFHHSPLLCLAPQWDDKQNNRTWGRDIWPFPCTTETQPFFTLKGRRGVGNFIGTWLFRGEFWKDTLGTLKAQCSHKYDLPVF